MVDRAATMTTTVARCATIAIAIVSKACKDAAVMGIAMDAKKGVATISQMAGAAENATGMAAGTNVWRGCPRNRRCNATKKVGVTSVRSTFMTRHMPSTIAGHAAMTTFITMMTTKLW
jgi:hypothetical protein